MAGIHRYHSGLAYVVHSSGGGARDFLDRPGYYGNIRPNLTGQPLLTGNPVSGESAFLLNKAAFALPPSFSTPPATNVSNPAYAASDANPAIFFGNSAPVLAGTRALAFYREDWNILKMARIKEGRDFEIGAEFFNVFNRHGSAGTDRSVHYAWLRDREVSPLDIGVGERGGSAGTDRSVHYASLRDREVSPLDIGVIQLRARFIF